MPFPFDTQLSLMQYRCIHFFLTDAHALLDLEEMKLALPKSVLSSFNF